MRCRRQVSAVDTRKVFAGDPVPDEVSTFDGLVVMGSRGRRSMITGFPTREREVTLSHTITRSRDDHARYLPRGTAPRSGRQEVRYLSEKRGLRSAGCSRSSAGGRPPVIPLLAGVPSSVTVLHWHGDTFDLPLGATHLAASRTYANQAFRVGERAWGFQFHLEVDQRAVTGFVDAFGDEARSVGQDPAAIAAATENRLHELGPIRDLVCGCFAKLVAAHERDLDLRGIRLIVAQLAWLGSEPGG